MKPKVYREYYQIVRMSEDKQTVEYYVGAENWSQYNQRQNRWFMDLEQACQKGTQKPGWEVYGLPQVREHLEEIRVNRVNIKPDLFVIMRTQDVIIE